MKLPAHRAGLPGDVRTITGSASSPPLQQEGGASSRLAREIYGITSQIRRSAVSIPANIAEGCGRNGEAEFARFLQIAMGSASELEYHLLLARDLNLLKNSEHEKLTNEVIDVKRMLTSFIQKLRAEG